MKEHIVKDKILEYLCLPDRDGKRNSPKEISKHIGVSSDYVIWCLHNIINDRYADSIALKSFSVQKIDIGISNWITPYGRFFLYHRGGYTNLHNNIRNNKIWTATKTIAAIINALAIISIAIWGVYVNDKSNELDKSVHQNEMLTNQVDSLQTVLSNYKNVDKTDTSTVEKRNP